MFFVKSVPDMPHFTGVAMHLRPLEVSFLHIISIYQQTRKGANVLPSTGTDVIVAVNVPLLSASACV